MKRLKRLILEITQLSRLLEITPIDKAHTTSHLSSIATVSFPRNRRVIFYKIGAHVANNTLNSIVPVKYDSRNEPVSSKVNHLRGTRFEEKRKQRF